MKTKSFERRAAELLVPLGFKHDKRRFWKLDDGVYQIVHIQPGAFGRYFFINVGVQPVALPRLLADRIALPNDPRRIEPIIQQRLEQIVGDGEYTPVNALFVSMTDNEQVGQTLDVLTSDGVAWLTRWGRHDMIANAPDEVLQRMLNVAPILRRKACAMVRTVSFLHLGNLDRAQIEFAAYLVASPGGYDLTKVDDYLRGLLAKNVAASVRERLA